MDYNNIDDIFKKHYNKSGSFDNHDKQWAIISDRIKADKKRRFLLISCLVIFSIAISLSLFALRKGTKSINTEQENSSQVTNINTAKLSSSNTPIDLKKDSTLTNNKVEPIRANATSSHSVVTNNNLDSKKPEIKTEQNQGKTKIEKTHNGSYLPLIGNQDQAISQIIKAINDQNTLPNKKKLTAIKTLPKLRSSLSYKGVNAVINVNSASVESITNVDKSNKISFGINTGFDRLYINNVSIIDTSKFNPFLGIYFKIQNQFELGISYTNRQINKHVIADFEKFNLPEGEIYGYPLVTDTYLSYKNNDINVQLNYTLPKRLSFLNTGIGTSIQQNKQIRITNVSANVYGIESEILTQDDTKFYFSNVTLGIGCRIPVLRRASLYTRYDRYIQLITDNIKWSNQHHIQLGLSYDIN